MTADPLDNPIWHALTGPHAAIASGTADALRYPHDVAAFYGVSDPLGHGADAIGDIAADGDIAVLFATRDLVTPRGCERVFVGRFDQMVCTRVRADATEAGTFEPTELGEADGDEMRALAKLTEPGPFLARTHTLGGFLGVREGGSLVAMAGTRLRINGATEISAVCTHPAARGRGHAAQLVRRLTSEITARGERAFLHVSVDNPAARRIYERIGFETRTLMTIQVFLVGETP